MKSMSESKCYKNRQVFPQYINHHHTMFGGTLMANIDEIAAITAMKHAGAQVVTTLRYSVDFLKPIKTGDILQYVAMVSYAGTSSMEVVVQIRIDDVFNNKHDLAALSYLTFVALDDEKANLNMYLVYIQKMMLKNGFMIQHHNVLNEEKHVALKVNKQLNI